jgi:hypothetical protein
MWAPVYTTCIALSWQTVPRDVRRRLLLALAAATLLLPACSEDPSATESTPPSATVEQVGVELPDPAAGDTAATSPTTATDPGTCAVQLSGGVTASWTGTGGDSGATYGPWISPAFQKADGDSVVPVPDTYFVVTCSGDDGRSVSFTAAGSIPRRAAVYRFRHTATGQSPDDLMQVLVSPDGSALWTVADNSSKLTIDAFDQRHVAGEFDLTIAAPGGSATTSAATTVKVTGTFDFADTTNT